MFKKETDTHDTVKRYGRTDCTVHVKCKQMTSPRITHRKHQENSTCVTSFSSKQPELHGARLKPLSVIPYVNSIVGRLLFEK